MGTVTEERQGTRWAARAPAVSARTRVRVPLTLGGTQLALRNALTAYAIVAGTSVTAASRLLRAGRRG